MLLSLSIREVQLLTSIVGTLLSCKHFSKEDYEVLINKVKTYGGMVCSHTILSH